MNCVHAIFFTYIQIYFLLFYIDFKALHEYIVHARTENGKCIKQTKNEMR